VARDEPRGKVLLDMNNPDFQRDLFGLERSELAQAADGLRRLRGMDWNDVYRSAGLKWERLQHIQAGSAPVYSLRLSRKFRAIALRDGDWLRILSLHPDHDSAYDS